MLQLLPNTMHLHISVDIMVTAQVTCYGRLVLLLWLLLLLLLPMACCAAAITAAAAIAVTELNTWHA
jgi:hypothetical protein